MTGMVLNGKAVCCMHMGSFEEAETLLLEALNKVCTDCTPLQQWELMKILFFIFIFFGDA
jgi:hypothetical protein